MSRETLFLFAPGAGAPSSSDWMTHWAKRLEKMGRVIRFDYEYQRERRRRPDPQPRLIAAHKAALAEARAGWQGRVVLAGKSMGSRMGCHLSLEEPVDALVCFGYPLKSPAGALRDEVLLKLKTPVLFIQGTRDKLCPLEELARVRERMTAPHELYVVEGGDHSLQVSKRLPQEPVDDAIEAAVRDFLGRHE